MTFDRLLLQRNATRYTDGSHRSCVVNQGEPVPGRFGNVRSSVFFTDEGSGSSVACRVAVPPRIWQCSASPHVPFTQQGPSVWPCGGTHNFRESYRTIKFPCLITSEGPVALGGAVKRIQWHVCVRLQTPRAPTGRRGYAVAAGGDRKGSCHWRL